MRLPYGGVSDYDKNDISYLQFASVLRAHD